MKMDIACPAELLQVELTSFGGERRQAYLTFLNESAYVISAISGRLELLDAHGRLLEDCRIAFGDISAAPGERFTCHMATDAYPAFESATMMIEDVIFDSEEPWALHPARLKEYDLPALPEGHERNALLAIAGEDAICYPENQGSVWLCVCGRFNRWRWTTCRRCARDRDETLDHFSRERIQADYIERERAARQKPPRVIMDGPARRRAQTERERVTSAPKQDAPNRPSFSFRRHIPVIVLSVAVLAVLIWGAISLSSRMPQAPSVNPSTGASLTYDYLEPVS
ncbi:hypothetical protein LJC74_01765 [Eubacteriales bacterium OttesenSCG-928-A19]|nr:hypothetical protein [Eubacteriales bacterium OttesenSCG-928-A19]